jgi:hypothetical protein
MDHLHTTEAVCGRLLLLAAEALAWRTRAPARRESQAPPGWSTAVLVVSR